MTKGRKTVALTDHPASFVPSLRAAVRGRVISREDPEYDAARTVASGDIDLYPEVIVRVTHVEDVRRVIDFARRASRSRCAAGAIASRGTAWSRMASS